MGQKVFNPFYYKWYKGIYKLQYIHEIPNIQKHSAIKQVGNQQEMVEWKLQLSSQGYTEHKPREEKGLLN